MKILKKDVTTATPGLTQFK